MGESHATPPEARPARALDPRPRYRVELLHEVRADASGLWHRVDGREQRIGWDEVVYAAAAEVGEPEGVRAIVFDLVLGRDPQGWRAARLDADPGPFAEELARAIHAGVASRQRAASLKSLARDGVASQWYPDLDSFEEALLAALASAAA
jgi:hypothetical protein